MSMINLFCIRKMTSQNFKPIKTLFLPKNRIWMFQEKMTDIKKDQCNEGNDQLGQLPQGLDA